MLERQEAGLIPLSEVQDEIRAKIRGIVDAPYPAMAPRLERIMDLDAAALDAGWAETVAEMTA